MQVLDARPSYGSLPGSRISYSEAPLREKVLKPRAIGCAGETGHSVTYPSPPMSSPPTPSRNFPRSSSERTSSIRPSPPGPPVTLPPLWQASRPEPRPAAVEEAPTAQVPLTYPIASIPPAPTESQVGAAYGSGPLPAANQPLGIQLSPTSSPARPLRSARRTKAHVASACINCKRAHLSCDTQRPCMRCVSTGKQAGCIDVQHKKRGRPRLREDRESRGGEHEAARPPTIHEASAYPSASGQESLHHQRTPSGRLIRTQHRSPISGLQEGIYAGYPAAVPLPGGVAAAAARTSPAAPTIERLPTAFALINLDGRILHFSPRFGELVAPGQDLRSKPLLEFIDPHHCEELHNVRGRLREERDQREPNYLPPIQQPSLVEHFTERDLPTLTQQSREHHFKWTFLTYDRRTPMPVQIRLGRSSSLFLGVVTLHPPVQPAYSLLPPLKVETNTTGTHFPPRKLAQTMSASPHVYHSAASVYPAFHGHSASLPSVSMPIEHPPSLTTSMTFPQQQQLGPRPAPASHSGPHSAPPAAPYSHAQLHFPQPVQLPPITGSRDPSEPSMTRSAPSESRPRSATTVSAPSAGRESSSDQERSAKRRRLDISDVLD